MNDVRRSGVLLHLTSLPGRYGIGSMNRDAYEWVDFLESTRQTLWQVLPLGPTGYGDSPYQSFSTFAGNPRYCAWLRICAARSRCAGSASAWQAAMIAMRRRRCVAG